MNTHNRKYKDSVFVDLFAKDEKAKENFLELYNAMYGTNLTPEETELKPVMIEQVLYMGYYNDVSMLVNGKLIVMIEHQSTLNENMPLRMLEYVARIYEKIIPRRGKFHRKRLTIPRPDLYVFYDAPQGYPPESEMKLSDAFCDKIVQTDVVPLEIIVKVVNINIEGGNPLLEQCAVLRQYAQFVAQVKEQIAQGNPAAIKEAVKWASDNGILSEYLQRKSTEVENMLLTEYDYDTDISVQRQEARMEGIQTGIAKGEYQKAIATAKNALAMKLPLEQIMLLTGLPQETIQQLQ